MDQLNKENHNRILDSLSRVKENFLIKNPLSFERWNKAQEVMPGGNTRTVLHYEPFPLAVERGVGTHLYSLDNDCYLDFLGEYSAGLYGHSNSKILAAIKDAIDSGLVLGAPNKWESLLAEELCTRFNSIDKVRFTNSGTEANLMAIGAARAFTGRDKIMVFNGSYHGGVLYFKDNPSPVNAPYNIIKSQYNDVERTIELIKENMTDLAAVLVEPMLGSGGCIPASTEFIKSIRDTTQKCGVCLIFDEVMTSRSSSGGLQELLQVNPDITTLGKYLGGGASFGAFGGRSDIMALWDPTVPNALAHAGTFNNNTISMSAGFTGLTEVFTASVASDLFNKGENFKDTLNDLCKRYDVNLQVTGVGSILGLHVRDGVILQPPKYSSSELNKLKLIHLEMSLRGFLFAQRGYMTLNIEMKDIHLEKFVNAFEDVIVSHKDIFSSRV